MFKDIIKNFFANLSLNKKLIFTMLFLNLILVSIILLMYSQTEQLLLKELQQQTMELTKAIQIGVEEITSEGITDDERLSKYLKNLNAKGIKEISVISNADEIVASTNTAKIGQPITHKRKELIIKAELGEPVSVEGSAYNVILPVIAGNTQYGYIHLKINKDDFSKIVRSNALKRIIATFFVFGLGIILALILSKQYTKPIKNVVEAARKVAMGDFDQSLPVYGKNEIGHLSESFNFMVKKLKEIRKLEERVREAEHLSGLGQFSRNMAHEIRNPLNFINLSIDYISEKYSQRDERFQKLILGIKQEIQRLDNIVNNFLTYSRPLKLNLQDVNIKDSIEDIILLIWSKAESEGIVIKRDYRDNVIVRLDRDLFKSCLLNIISNAIQAMEFSEKKELIIKTEFKEENFIISIKDTGVGVMDKEIPKIFEPFFTTKENGIGLGLPMTMRIIEEHGGMIDFESEIGVGSTVSIILPKDILIST
jgi:nitrogen fixation/metabolism regulation signal transduction histidine kinase